MWKNAYQQPDLRNTLILAKYSFFNNVIFEIAMFVSEWCLWWATSTPPGGDKRSHGHKTFYSIFTRNFDISVSHRELTLYTIQVHIFRPLDFTHINNCFKNFSINYNAAPNLFAKHSSFQYKL